MQSRSTYTDRYDEVQVDQGRLEQPPRREVAPTIGVPEGKHTYKEEEMRTTRAYKHESSINAPQSLVFRLHSRLSVSMWVSGRIGFATYRLLHRQ